MYRLLIFALAGWLLFQIHGYAADASSLPSRKAVAVLPLLRQFSVKDGYARILQILGKEDMDAGSSLLDCRFKLDDGTTIEVEASPNGNPVYFIHRHMNDAKQSVEVIYEKVEKMEAMN